MTADELRRTAVLIERTDLDAIDRAADYLRACADAMEVLRLVLDALVWEVGSEPALCAGKTRRAIERARALLNKRGAA